jgi:hypothetical protein
MRCYCMILVNIVKRCTYWLCFFVNLSFDSVIIFSPRNIIGDDSKNELTIVRVVVL